MEFQYLTVGKEARSEQIIEKSRFIATVRPVSTREEAEAFFAEVRREFRDATHNVPAMVIGEKMQVQWGSDDGEPQGTSGAPIVQMLVNRGITNVAIVVTRYFGGVKLGTGGLVRAYTSSAERVLSEAGTAAAVPFTMSRVETDYAIYNKIMNYRFPDEFKSMAIENAEFAERVSFNISSTREIYERIKNLLTEISGGNIVFSESEEVIRLLVLEGSE